MPTLRIASLITEFIQSTPSAPLMFTFTIPAHAEIGALLLGSFFRWTILGELYDEPKVTYSRMHLKLLECLSSAEQIAPAKPIVATKYLEIIVDQIERAIPIRSPEVITRSIEKFAQLIQVSKPFLYGNIPRFIERLDQSLPKNGSCPLMDLVRMSLPSAGK